MVSRIKHAVLRTLTSLASLRLARGGSLQQRAQTRRWVFATCMSLLSVNLVSLVLLSRTGLPWLQLLSRWIDALSISWPLVFTCIYWGAPWVMRFTHWLVPDEASQ